jgi:hypothetical protein
LHGTHRQIAALPRCVEDLVHRLRSSALFVALSSLCGACFVETPGLDEQDTTTEAGLVCNPDVQLCIPESCNPGEMDCVCNDGACLPGLACEGGLCVDAGSSSTPSTTDDESSATMPDSSDDADASATDSTGATSDPTTGEDTLPLDESSSDDSDPTGEEMCSDLACTACLDCVDNDECKGVFDACEDVGGCATAVDCIVTCALGIDCLDPCCEGLSMEQAAAVNALVLCKSDKCLDPCARPAEFYTCD